MGGNTFLQCECDDAELLFRVWFCFASESKLCEVIDSKTEIHGVIENPYPTQAPRFLKEC